MKKIKLRIKQFVSVIKYIYYYIYCKLLGIDNSDVWLISERGDEARDNGYAFYRYLTKKRSNIDARYVITNNSSDIGKFSKNDKLVQYGSKEHYILFISSGLLISTHIMGFSPEFRVFTKLDKYNLIKVKGKKVFLQHGITKDYSEGLKKDNIKLDLFICGAKPEYDFLLKITGFNDKVIRYTGFARYDLLSQNDNKKYILVMPTWRKNLFYCKNNYEFQKTEYFQKWSEILNDKEINELLNEKKCKMVFYPHYEIQPYIKSFVNHCSNIIVAESKEYDIQTLLTESSMLITDYSSVYFDMAYMRKPIIYYQFDYEQYRKYHYQKGYFDYKIDGFGNVVYNLSQLKDQLKKYMNNQYSVEQEFQTRRNKYFLYNDFNNCERIFEEINMINNKY